MFENHTIQITDSILDLQDHDLAEIWADIEATPEDTTAEKWKKKLQKIAYDCSFSSRFALMRILCGRAGAREEAGFEAEAEGTLCRFEDISLKHAQMLTVEEHRQYLALLLEQADRQADSDPEINEEMIRRAWLDEESANALDERLLPDSVRADEKKLQKARKTFQKENKALYKNRITREEALLLGHILDFTLPEMQWFLLRVLDTGDGFRFNQSADLIEVYGFLTGASWQHVKQLKQQYAQNSASVVRVDDTVRDREWTRNMVDSLPELVARWKYFPETMDQQFLAWMNTQAPGLDLPSHTACRIYRNLAVFAYDLITGEEYPPEEAEFLGSIQDLCLNTEESGAVQRHLYEGSEISSACCKKVADILLLENKVQSASIQADNAKAWHILTTRADGSLSAAGGMVNSSRTRVRDILTGKVQAEKGDMMYLLWFIANLVWQGTGEPDAGTVCSRIMDFMDAAKEVLDAALLPEFYVPHIMEQSMLLSIAMSGEEDSSVVYEYILQNLTATRNREQGSRKHTQEEQIRIVCHYLDKSREVTLDDCAAQYDISPKTLSAWVKDLKERGIV